MFSFSIPLYLENYTQESRSYLEKASDNDDEDKDLKPVNFCEAPQENAQFVEIGCGRVPPYLGLDRCAMPPL